MEEQCVWESEGVEQPSTTEETIVAMIFTECDTEGTGYVPVLKLMHFMLSKADQKLDRSLLDDLQQMLDPQGYNVDVTRQTFETAMKDWAEKVKNKVNISCMDGPHSCYGGVTDFVQFPYNDQTSPSSDPAFACDLDTSSFSCGGSEAGNVPPTVETNNLAECVMELKHAKKWLEDQNKDLQSQIHSSENSYAMLQSDYKNTCDKLCSLQSSVEQYHLLQKEYEDLKDAKSTAEECLVVFKLRVQQLEKEAQTHNRQLSKLENQKTELVLELEISKKKNQELQKMVIVQKMENEELLKQCSKHELLNNKQLDTISELDDRVNDLLSHIKHLQEEKQSLQVSLASMTDEFQSVNSQSPHDVTKKLVSTATNDGDDEEYLSAASSLFWSMEDQQRSLLSEFEALNEAPDSTNDTLTQNTVDVQDSQEMHLQWKIAFLNDQYQATVFELRKLEKQQVGYSAECSSSVSSMLNRLQNGLPWDEFASSPSKHNMTDQEVQCEMYPEILNQEIQTSPVDVDDVEQNLQSIVTPAKSDSNMNLDEQPCCEEQKTSCSDDIFENTSVPVSDVVPLDMQSVPLFHPVTELQKWVRDTDVLIAIRRKANLQAKSGGICDVVDMEHPEPSEQEATSMPRCMSESQVVASVNSGSSVSSEASSCSADVFPSLANGVLQQLRLDAAATASDVLSDHEIENKFSTLSLAFKTDKLTLVTRHDRQQRQRDQAERNMAVEIMELKSAVHSLNYLCKDSESIEILGKIQDQIDILQQSAELVSSSAEIFGAVQQEIRVSKAIEVMLTHVENLKRMYEKEHAELEETKRVLLENNLVVAGNADSTDGSLKNPRHRILSALSNQGKQRRRASIAVFRPLNSQDSTKASHIPPTFGDTKRSVPHSRRTSSAQVDSPSPTWDRKDRLDRTEVIVGSMDGIRELAEGSCDDSVNSDEQSTIVEENNNCTDIHKSSHCDSPTAVTGGDVTYISGNAAKNPAQSDEANEDCTKDSDFSSTSLMQNLDSLRSFRDTAVEFMCQTRVTIVDSMTSLNTDYMLIQTRRCATFLLLFAAFWSLVSTFVPTTAQPRDYIPFSWLTLKDVLDQYIQLEHYGRPPT